MLRMECPTRFSACFAGKGLPNKTAARKILDKNFNINFTLNSSKIFYCSTDVMY